MAAEWRCIGAVMSTDVKHPVFPRVIVGKGRYGLAPGVRTVDAGDIPVGKGGKDGGIENFIRHTMQYFTHSCISSYRAPL